MMGSPAHYKIPHCKQKGKFCLLTHVIPNLYAIFYFALFCYIFDEQWFPLTIFYVHFKISCTSCRFNLTFFMQHPKFALKMCISFPFDETDCLSLSYLVWRCNCLQKHVCAYYYTFSFSIQVVWCVFWTFTQTNSFVFDSLITSKEFTCAISHHRFR